VVGAFVIVGGNFGCRRAKCRFSIIHAVVLIAWPIGVHDKLTCVEGVTLVIVRPALRFCYCRIRPKSRLIDAQIKQQNSLKFGNSDCTQKQSVPKLIACKGEAYLCFRALKTVQITHTQIYALSKSFALWKRSVLDKAQCDCSIEPCKGEVYLS